MSTLKAIIGTGLLILGSLMASPTHAQDQARSPEEVDRLVEAAVARLKSLQPIQVGVKSGAFEGELTDMQRGGVTALATLALLSAGLGEEDNSINLAIAYLAEVEMQGTYARALRANVWAALMNRAGRQNRAKYFRMLQKDVDWLAAAIDGQGWYTYGREPQRGDHSCSQFGVLGVWAGDDAGAHISRDYWSKVAEHWLRFQNADGSWSYESRGEGTATMTTAGITTLHIALAQFYTQNEPPYRLFEGIALSDKRWEAVERTMQAAQNGMRWLADRDLLAGQWRDYQLFGLQRLNLASGFKYVGSQDWYARGLAVINGFDGKGTIETAFQLIFLTTSRAPVLFNKLQYGDGFTWNRYYRDLFFLTRELSRQQEHLYRWQIVSLFSLMHDLLDAPFLYISGDAELAFDADSQARLREYVDRGGTIVGHAERSQAAFSSSFKSVMQQTFADRGWQFDTLPADHAIYSVLYGKGDSAWKSNIPIEAMSDGARLSVILFPADVAGAWHQDLRTDQKELFRIMANLRILNAPRYDELPHPLRPKVPMDTAVESRGKLTIGRLKIGEAWLCHPLLWSNLGELSQRELGVQLEVRDYDPTSTEALTSLPPRLLHLTGHREFAPSPEQLEALLKYLNGGGLLWIDCAGDQKLFVDAAEKLVNQLSQKLNQPVETLPADHPLISKLDERLPQLDQVRLNSWGGPRLAATRHPLIKSVSVSGRPAVLFAPYDISATVDGHFVHGAAGYQRKDAEQLMLHLIAWRFAETQKP